MQKRNLWSEFLDLCKMSLCEYWIGGVLDNIDIFY